MHYILFMNCFFFFRERCDVRTEGSGHRHAVPLRSLCPAYPGPLLSAATTTLLKRLRDENKVLKRETYSTGIKGQKIDKHC